jgi:alpha-L-rhamnosidase
MYEYLAGIRSYPERPGFKRAIIRPVPAGDLTFVKASHRSMYGTIATSWRRDAGHFTLEVTIPPNTSALVTLPARDAATVTESGRPTAAARGVKFLRIEPGAATYEVQSGTYTFRSTAVTTILSAPSP